MEGHLRLHSPLAFKAVNKGHVCFFMDPIDYFLIISSLISYHHLDTIVKSRIRCLQERYDGAAHRSWVRINQTAGAVFACSCACVGSYQLQRYERVRLTGNSKACVGKAVCLFALAQQYTGNLSMVYTNFCWDKFQP